MIGLSIEKIRAALVKHHGGVSENSTDTQCRTLWTMLTDNNRRDYLASLDPTEPVTEPEPLPELEVVLEPEPKPAPKKQKRRNT